MQQQKPNLEDIHKQQEDKAFQKWAQMILKQKDKQKHIEKSKKDNEKLLKDNALKFNEKLDHAKKMKKDEQLQYKEKCSKLMEKHKNIDTKIKERDQRIDIFTKKHKQLNELRF